MLDWEDREDDVHYNVDTMHAASRERASEGFMWVTNILPGAVGLGSIEDRIQRFYVRYGEENCEVMIPALDTFGETLSGAGVGMYVTKAALAAKGREPIL